MFIGAERGSRRALRGIKREYPVMCKDEARDPTHGERRGRSEVHDFLDGSLGAEQEADFRQRRDADPKLDARVSQLENVDTLLRAEFGGLAETPGQVRRSRAMTPRFAALATAAALLLATLAWVYVTPQPTAAPIRGPLPIAELYLEHTRDFIPEIVCDTPEKLLAYTAEAFGTAITASFDTEIGLVGWKSEVYSDARDDNGSHVLLSTGPRGERIVTLFLQEGP
ncbi:MAG: hypothetical protein AAFR96_13150, partial [Planctomycetota bacterium]